MWAGSRPAWNAAGSVAGSHHRPSGGSFPLPPPTRVGGCGGLEQGGSLPPRPHNLKGGFAKAASIRQRSLPELGGVLAALECKALFDSLGGLPRALDFPAVFVHCTAFNRLCSFESAWAAHMAKKYFPGVSEDGWFPFLPVQKESCSPHTGSAGVITKQRGLAK